MKNKILFIAFVCVVSCNMFAQNQNPILIFLQMPDSVCPYFDQQAKMRMLELYRANDTIGLDNFTGGKSRIAEITEKHISVIVSEQYKITIYLRSEDFMFIETACAPVCSSIAKIYEGSWQYKQTLPVDKNKFLEIAIANELPQYINHTNELTN